MPRETSAEKVANALQAIGFDQRRNLGGHLILGHSKSGAQVTLPARTAVSPQMLRSVIRQIEGFGLATEGQFLRLLER